MYADKNKGKRKMSLDKIYDGMPDIFKTMWRFRKQKNITAYTKNGTVLFENGLTRKICDSYEKDYFSQYGQDAFCTNYIFHRKKGGFFIDVGANHPLKFNNTAYLEKELGWSGLAFEPQKELANLWKKERQTECVPVALGKSEEKIKFYRDGDCGDSCYMKSGKSFKPRRESYFVRQKRLQDILDQRKIAVVDFMSIDVEGYELEVLKGVDLQKTHISCILLENEERRVKKCRETRQFLFENGYDLFARLTGDDVFVKGKIL